MSLQSRISGESIAGQCPAVMPQHSHPYVGRLILDPVIPTGGGQIPTMAGLGTKEKAPQGACTASTMFPYGAYSEEDLVEGSFKVRVGDAGNAGNHHSTQGGVSLSSEKWNPNSIRVSPTEEPSLRDQFAMVAIRKYAMNKETYKENAKRAYKMADAMMEARK